MYAYFQLIIKRDIRLHLRRIKNSDELINASHNFRARPEQTGLRTIQPNCSLIYFTEAYTRVLLLIIVRSSVGGRLFRSASFPQKDVRQEMENDVNDSHEKDVGPEVALVEVVTVQHLGAFGEAR